MTALTNWPWQHWAETTPDSMALRTDRGDYRWRDLASAIDGLAALWRRAGVVTGSGVALRGKNSLPMLLGYLAALRCGARVIPLAPQLPAALLAQRLPTLDVDFGWCASGLPWPAGIAPLDWPSGGAGAPGAPAWQAERLATLTLTSGSSGLPKAAAHTFAAHLASAEGVNGMIGFRPGHCWLLSLPLYHVSGQGIVWRWLSTGATLKMSGETQLTKALDGCSHASLVPTQLWRLLKEEPAPALGDVLLGGAMIQPELTQQAEARGIRCWCGYGLTEFASTVCAKRANGTPGVGLPLAGRELRLVAGEVWLRGASMAAGYWQQGGLLPLADAEGWFHTRDGGRISGGELHIAGRLDNLFFCGGESVQPEDIERILATHPEVRQSFVVPLEDEEFGQRPVAVVEGEVDFNQLSAWLEPQLAPWQRPVAYLGLPDSLRGGGIKIPRSRIKQWAAEQLRLKP